jgi:hypothetical protein
MWIDWCRKYQPAETEYEVWWPYIKLGTVVSAISTRIVLQNILVTILDNLCWDVIILRHKYLWTMFWGRVFWIFWIMWFFPRKYKYRCIRIYLWSKDDKHVISMWIWLILKNISLPDRIWSLWFVPFANSPPNFIFCLGRLIFSASINSHPDNIYLF